jgi:hypothetical protein
MIWVEGEQVSRSQESGGGPPLPDLSGISLRALAAADLLAPEERSALAEALRRLHEADGSAPSLLTHDDTP